VPLGGSVDLLGTLPTLDGIVWLHEGTGFVAWGKAVRMDPGVGSGRFTRASEAACTLFDEIEREPDGEGPGPLVFGSFTFARDAPGSWLVVPAVVLRWTGEAAWLTVTARGDVAGDGEDGETLLRRLSDSGDPRWAAPPGPRAVRNSNGAGSEPQSGAAPAAAREPRSDRSPAAGREPLSDGSWMAAVASARRWIRQGRLLKVVLARDVVVEQQAPFDPRAIAGRLAERYPECYTFACEGMVGASPELLVRREGPTLTSLTLAGSARRGDDPATDERAGVELLRSHKDRWEHELAVRFVHDTLTRCCSELWVDPEPSLLRLANVQHLATNTYGLLTRPVSAIELAGRLHPGAAICGTPTVEALEVIGELEGMDRGHYAAPVGWMDAGGDGEWAIALRCAELSGSRARLFAGAGIVAESDPESELEETRLKLRPILSALEDATERDGQRQERPRAREGDRPT
jgi:menaquinone-specific isochorismate synthase